MNTIGKPCEGKLQARFDEGALPMEVIYYFRWQALLYALMPNDTSTTIYIDNFNKCDLGTGKHR